MARGDLIVSAKELVAPDFDVSIKVLQIVLYKFLFGVANMMFHEGEVASVEFLEDFLTVHLNVAKGIFVEKE